MIGTITSVKEGFGFITEAGSERVWYFSFYDFKPGSLPQESMKVSFERKNDSQKFKRDLEAGILKDAVEGFRNPKLRKTQRGHGMPLAPSAAKVEILAEQEERCEVKRNCNV